MIKHFSSKVEADGHPSPNPTKLWEISPLRPISAHITLEGIDRFGRVHSGAKLVPSSIVVTINISDVSYLPAFPPITLTSNTTPCPKALDYRHGRHRPVKCNLYPREALHHSYVCFNQNPEILTLIEFCCLRLGRRVSRLSLGGDGKEVVDMGLVKWGEGECYYRRVGIFEVEVGEEWIEKGQVRTLTIV